MLRMALALRRVEVSGGWNLTRQVSAVALEHLGGLQVGEGQSDRLGFAPRLRLAFRLFCFYAFGWLWSVGGSFVSVIGWRLVLQRKIDSGDRVLARLIGSKKCVPSKAVVMTCRRLNRNRGRGEVRPLGRTPRGSNEMSIGRRRIQGG